MKKDYVKYFKERFKYWIDFYGMWDWEFYFKVKDMGPDGLAEVHCQTPGMMVTVHVSKDIEEVCGRQGNTEEEINTTAHHEVLEVMLDGLYNMAVERNFDTDEWAREAHRVIYRIQRAQHNNIHDKKKANGPADKS